MSKTFETNALKGKSLACGMKKRLSELSKYGVKEEDLTAMEQDAEKAIEMIKEVDRMRIETSQRLEAANARLNVLKGKADEYRKLIKAHYSPDQWERFGLLDKR